MVHKALIGVILGLAAGGAFAQTAPSPADVGIVHGNPDVFKLLDSSNTWAPFGSIDPSSHIFTPVGGGGGGGGGAFTIYSTHSGLVSLATTPTGPWTVVQQGFWAAGDGGAATYDWNATSLCTSGGGVWGELANDVTCILPAGQNSGTPGRYLLRLTNGVIDARQVGFKDDGTDNSPRVPILNNVVTSNPYGGGFGIVFTASPTKLQSDYWFNKPFIMNKTMTINCGDGGRVTAVSRVNLVFGPDAGGMNVAGSNQDNSQGASQVNINGCGIISTGHSTNGAGVAAGSTVIPNSRVALPNVLGSETSRGDTQWSVGDGIAAFPGPVYWFFSGYIVNDILTVTTFSSGWSTFDPGIAVGQLVKTIPTLGIAIKSTHAEEPAMTGTGHEGTYRLSYSIQNPPVAAQAIPTGLYASAASPAGMETERGTGSPQVLPGTTITGCSAATGSVCADGVGTLTLSSGMQYGSPFDMWLLPGPATTSPVGDQSYTYTTNPTGNTLTPITAGVSGGVMTVTAGPGGIQLGDAISGGYGGFATTTTTGAITFGQYQNIPVTSCTGLTGGQLVAGFSGGVSIFPPGSTIDTCTSNLLNLSLPIFPRPLFNTVSGSNVIQQTTTYYFNAWNIFKGDPIIGPGIPANTTIQDWRLTPYNTSMVDITLSNPATATGTLVTLAIGGAMQAAASGAVIDTVNASNGYVIGFGTGTGGNGTYNVWGTPDFPAGTKIIDYKTPGAIHITSGPRIPYSQEFIWADGFRFGTMVGYVFGSSTSNLAIIPRSIDSYGQPASFPKIGSNKMWVLPPGLLRSTGGNSYGNLIYGFPAAGISMACASANYYPPSGCGRSYDNNNTVVYNLIGSMVVGNNAGGFFFSNNEYDHNHVADIVDMSTVAGSYVGEMLQGEDESSNTHVVFGGCKSGSVYMSIYASGSGENSSCMFAVDDITSNPYYQTNEGASQAAFAQWFGALYGGPFDISIVTSVALPQVSCTGVPTSSFTVFNGAVTHC